MQAILRAPCDKASLFWINHWGVFKHVQTELKARADVQEPAQKLRVSVGGNLVTGVELNMFNALTCLLIDCMLDKLNANASPKRVYCDILPRITALKDHCLHLKPFLPLAVMSSLFSPAGSDTCHAACMSSCKLSKGWSS